MYSTSPPPAGARTVRARPAPRLARRHHLLVALVTMGMAAAACGSPVGPNPTGPANVVQSDVTREPPHADAPVGQVSAGLDDLALQLSLLDESNGNLVLSPVSLGVAFAMVEAGSTEPTTTEIEEVFGFPHQPYVHQAMNSLLAGFQEANQTTPSGAVVLDLANTLWAQDGLAIGDPFLDTLARHYGAGVHVTDFAHDPAGSRQAINASVAQTTRNRIPNLVPERMVTPQTVTMLINALYLKAPWGHQFNDDLTLPAPFRLGDGTTVQVPTMHTFGWLTRAAVGDGYTAVELPYAGGKLIMTIVSPKAGTTLRQFEEGLTADSLRHIVDGTEPRLVELAMPRWQADTQLNLGPVMSELGLAIPGGDLSGMAPGVSLGAAIHAANITVDENGTEAAAATAISGVTSAPSGESLKVVIDRPFIFVIRHAETGAPLFYGRITDPRG
jgi:serpin B